MSLSSRTFLALLMTAAAAGQQARAQDEAERPAPPPGAAARVGDELISLDEYREYLLTLYGKRELQSLVYERLLEAEAAKLGITVTEDELDEAAERQLDVLLRRNRGDAAAMRRELASEGYTPETYTASLRGRTRQQLLAERICVATRTVSEEQIRVRFEREYGVGGTRVEVRHLFLNPAKLQRELERSGEDPASLTPAVVEERLRTRAQGYLDQIRRGGDFEALAREHSHDISVRQNGGVIPGYNYRRYGPELAEAVRAAEVGVPAGPVRTKTGIHVIEVLGRTQTQLDDVREKLRAELQAEPPNGEELRDLELRLRRETPVEIY